jgi:hypothetical protein
MLLDFLDGMVCFFDVNIFYYALVPTPGVSQPCLALLNRVIAGRVLDAPPRPSPPRYQ